MKSSSARQPEFDFSSSDESTGSRDQPNAGREDMDISPAPTNTAPSPAGAFGLGVSSDLYAVASRRAGRLNAASISDNEIELLLGERERLLDKQFNESITHSEKIRLQYVRWQLDRIEDAREGETLDALENWITQYERFKEDLETLQRDLSRHKKGSRK